MNERTLPTLVAHADWSTDQSKRWIAVGRLVGHSYAVAVPESVGPLNSLLARLSARAAPGAVLVGFDFPIGLPVDYAKRAGISSFLSALQDFGTGRWARFYDVASRPEEISLTRPFYPSRPGGTLQAHLANGLGVERLPSLLRTCERGDGGRGDASVLFWTLGGKQVGRAAISGWRQVIAPALHNPAEKTAIWPFHGRLGTLLENSRIVLAETYPAEACRHIGLNPPGRGWSKRRQADRQNLSDKLFSWAERRCVVLSDGLAAAIREGFGPEASGEDRFDAFVGIASMIEISLGHRPDGAPNVDYILTYEGWILGQQSPT